jgi:vacuolar-type H+-ATPase subunit F/Vma7
MRSVAALKSSTGYAVVVVLIQCASLQDDVVKFISEPASPPRLVEIPDEGRSKAKERREVGEGDDTVVVEDTSDEDDEETL